MVPVLGESATFIVQTYRQKDVGDTVFLEHVSKEGSFRLAIPPAVTAAIKRDDQHRIHRRGDGAADVDIRDSHIQKRTGPSHHG